MIKYETWSPTHEERSIGLNELDSVYEQAAGKESPSFTWNDLGDDVIIVSVGDDYSVVSMLTEDTWYYLRGADSDGEAEICMAGQSATVPKCVVLPRERGLALLKEAGDSTDLLNRYSWVEQ